MKLKVAIFEDYSGLRENLARLIESTDDLMCTGTFENANKILANLDDTEPDIVLMDINMPGISGIEAVIILKEKHPQIQVLMLTVFEDNDKIFAAICAGAAGYMLKRTPPQKLLDAIREAHSGGSPMTPAVASKVMGMIRSQSGNAEKEFILLSEREKQILALLVKGKQYKIIAAECFISIDTVGTHVRHIYEKLHVHSKSEAVAKAIQQRLI
jgi:DNA-binding NarL/FixJ family response regulator